MLETYDMLLRLIKIQEDAGQMNTEEAEYILKLMDTYLAFRRISIEQYQDIAVKLNVITGKQEGGENDI